MNSKPNLAPLQTIASAIHLFTSSTGKLVSWLAIAMVLVSCSVVLMRYVFDYSPIMLQEAVMYFHGALFMLGASYAWQQDAHVRVDVFYRNWSANQQRLLNTCGTLFLLIPTCLFLLWVSWDYVTVAWSIGEKSQEAGGLPFVYIQKTLIVAMPCLMLIQAIAQLIKPLELNAEHEGQA